MVTFVFRKRYAALESFFASLSFEKIPRTESKPMPSRIWNSLTDYRFLVETQDEQEDHDEEEVRQILNVPAFRFWSVVFISLSICGMLLIILPLLQRLSLI